MISVAKQNDLMLVKMLISLFLFLPTVQKNKLKKVLIRCNCEHQKQIKTAVKEQNSYKLL